MLLSGCVPFSTSFAVGIFTDQILFYEIDQNIRAQKFVLLERLQVTKQNVNSISHRELGGTEDPTGSPQLEYGVR